jgi:phage RecT family recombinase
MATQAIEKVVTPSIRSMQAEDRLLALKQSRLKVLLKEDVKFQKMCEAATLLLNSEKLRQCDEASIYGALYKAVTLGCRLEPEFGECYLIPRKINVGTRERAEWVSVCCFQLGYKYWKNKALESGHIKYMETREVYAEDQFSFKYGSGAYWEHMPAQENRGVTIWFYAAAPLTTGGEVFQAINKQEAEKYRRMSESQWETTGTGQNRMRKFREKPTDIWAAHYASMALRLPVKKLCSMLPLTEAIESAMREDGAVTYIQQNGEMTRLSSGEIEALAEAVEVKELPVPEEQKEVFEQWQDAISVCADFDAVWKLYEQFKQSDLYQRKAFVSMFFEKFAAVATETDEQLGKVFHASKEWQKTPELVKILTTKKEQLEQQKQAAAK